MASPARARRAEVAAGARQGGDPLEHLLVRDSITQLGTQPDARDPRGDSKLVDGGERCEVLGGRAERGLIPAQDRVDAAIDEHDQIDLQVIDEPAIRGLQRAHANLVEAPDRTRSTRANEEVGEPRLRAIRGLDRRVGADLVQAADLVHLARAIESVEITERQAREMDLAAVGFEIGEQRDRAHDVVPTTGAREQDSTRITLRSHRVQDRR